MSKKASLASALQPFDRVPPATASAPTVHQPHSSTATIATQAPSRIGKKALIGYFDPGVSKQLKQMALDMDRTVQDLLAEALNDFFQKHKKATIA
ncbi:MAG: ribbon-helix-helix domain-containing protein [Bryobacteraceae bacterium]